MATHPDGTLHVTHVSLTKINSRAEQHLPCIRSVNSGFTSLPPARGTVAAYSNCTGWGYTFETGFVVMEIISFVTCKKFPGLNWYHVFKTDTVFSIGYKPTSLLQFSYWLVIFED